MRILIFGTTYVDSEDKAKLLGHWLKLHGRLNPNCKLLLIDSASPWDIERIVGNRAEIHIFPDNIGHLSRGGLDGWGRAFSRGLQWAIDNKFDYVVHIEGDSLFRYSVKPIVEVMAASGVNALSMPVQGCWGGVEGWAETGLMFFSVPFLRSFDLIGKYDWRKRLSKFIFPELIIAQLLGEELKLMPWRGERDDKKQISHNNVAQLDWVTHCHDPSVYDTFMAANYEKEPAEISVDNLTYCQGP